MTNRKPPVAIFTPDGDDADPSKAASQAPLGGLAGFGFKLETVAPKPSKATSNKEPISIEWPADVQTLARHLGITLPESEPGKGKSPAGSLLCIPKGSPHAGTAKVPTVASLKRRDGAAVWASWLSHGAQGQCPAMASGEALPLISVFRSLVGANLDGKAFRVLWNGSGDRTSIMGQLSAHTGKVVTLRLSAEFPVTLS